MTLRTTRRRFLAGGAAGVAMAWKGQAGAEEPRVLIPRATSGDDRAEPDWKERLTITVGPKKADVVGSGDKAIQAAVDYIARLGGGTVRVLPGEYRLRNSVFLASRVRLVGSGDDSILIKEPSHSTALSDDSDWYDQEITLKDPTGFEVGDGVCLRTKNPHNGGQDVLKRTLVARIGDRFKLDRALRQNFWLGQNATCSALFPIVTAENAVDMAVENILLDGNKRHNELLDGNYAGCLFFQDCSRIALRGVTARNYNGDGISWQICHDVLVEKCHSHDNTGLGLHPGSGSQRPRMIGNRLENNQIGIFFCWGVKFGLAEGNKVSGSREVGISIGHHDTDNLIRGNEVVGSGRHGVWFRPERNARFAPHRNRLENNRIVDNGPPDGIAVFVDGGVENVEIARNEIRDDRGPMQRVGVQIGKDARAIELIDNRLAGFAHPVRDLRKA